MQGWEVSIFIKFSGKMAHGQGKKLDHVTLKLR